MTYLVNTPQHGKNPQEITTQQTSPTQQERQDDRVNQKYLNLDERWLEPFHIKSHQEAGAISSGAFEQVTLLFPSDWKWLEHQIQTPAQHTLSPVMFVDGRFLQVPPTTVAHFPKSVYKVAVKSVHHRSTFPRAHVSPRHGRRTQSYQQGPFEKGMPFRQHEAAVATPALRHLGAHLALRKYSTLRTNWPSNCSSLVWSS